MEVVVLGSAAGGGFPQWNCNAPTSKRAREGSARAKWRTQASVAVSADGKRWVMLNASPDARQQLLQNQCLWPREGLRDSPVRAVVLTSAEIDHVAGLLSMRESQPFVLWGTRRVLGLLAENPIFGALNPQYVQRRAFDLGERIELAGSDGPLGLAMTAFAVPGKVPLFLEGRDPQHLAGSAEDTIGLEIAAGSSKFHYIPGCARMTPELEDRIRGSALVFFDGTLWSDDELVQLGISYKTGQRMGHMSINGGVGHVDRVRQARRRPQDLHPCEHHQPGAGRGFAGAGGGRRPWLGSGRRRNEDHPVTELMGPEELEAALRAIGAVRYHNRHPFHALLHGGKLTRGQVQAWALNRYYYQSIIPQKDAAILSRMTDRDIRRRLAPAHHRP